MAKLRASRVSYIVALLAICLGAAMLGNILRDNRVVDARSSPPKLPQPSDEKTIERMEFSNEPFEFGHLSVKNINVTLRKTFSAKILTEISGGTVDDWLENFQFSLKNTSNKQINHFLIEFQFPDT